MYYLFVVPPFQEPTNPAIGVSNLLSLTREMGFKSKILYENISLLQDLSLPVYNFIIGSAPSPTLLIGDFIYALLGMPEDRREDAINRYLKEIISEMLVNHPRIINAYKDFILKTMPVIEQAGVRTIERILAEDPDIVGFTIGANQLNAGLYLAKKLKEAVPKKQVWVGGSYCTGKVGYQLLKYFPFIDVMFTGESEKSLEAALKSFEYGEIAQINGVVTRQMCDAGEEIPEEKLCPQLVENLDELPIPDYSDYVDAIKKTGVADKIKPNLLMETSRGCWWAQKEPCYFCGLNMQTKKYRSKSAGRVLEEISQHIDKYGIYRIIMVDNVLNQRFFKDLFPSLKDRFKDLMIYYEVRCHLSKEELGILHDAGVKVVQGGVEALDYEMLELLHKGTHSWQNIQFIKWCEELDINIKYNLLYAIPRESTQMYRRVLKLLKCIHHLRPPTPARIHLDAGSVYDLELSRFGICKTGVNPAALNHCFPEEHIDPMLITHNFANGFINLDESLPVLWGEFIDEIGAWNDDYYRKHKILSYKIMGSLVRIADNRFSEETQYYEFDEAESAVLIFCDGAHTKESIMEGLGNFPPERIRDALERLCGLKIIYQLEDRYISLAVRNNQEMGSLKRSKRNIKDESYPLFQEVPETSKDFPWIYKNCINFFGFKYRHKRLFDNTVTSGGQNGE